MANKKTNSAEFDFNNLFIFEVSKNHAGSVDLGKRLVREFLRKNLVSFKPGFDVWILVQAGPSAQTGKPEFLLEANFWDKGLTRLFKKSGIYGSTSLPQDGR